MDINIFEKMPLLGILRGITDDMIQPIADISVSAGLNSIEITMNTEHAPHLIRQMKGYAGSELIVGAGTVLSMDSLNSALDAGATFIVMPCYISEIAEYCVSQGIPVFPGAITPNEVFTSWNVGATMIKLFPVRFYGPQYVLELKGPFDSVKFMACGGITPENLPLYFDAGVSAVAFGGEVYEQQLLKNKAYKSISLHLKKLVDSYKKWKDGTSE
jgi:2-dehydro-3-deoxyphosphogluconate aldolase / (4S)-4-hydroxy-2-oxoglutarate aldolase